jgi:hypothetical protein
MPKTTVTIYQKEIDLLKWTIKGLIGALVGLIVWQAQQLYSQVQDQEKDLARLRTHIIVLETKAGIEKPLREKRE